MVTVSVKQLVSAIEEADAFKLPDMKGKGGCKFPPGTNEKGSDDKDKSQIQMIQKISKKRRMRL